MNPYISVCPLSVFYIFLTLLLAVCFLLYYLCSAFISAFRTGTSDGRLCHFALFSRAVCLDLTQLSTILFSCLHLNSCDVLWLFCSLHFFCLSHSGPLQSLWVTEMYERKCIYCLSIVCGTNKLIFLKRFIADSAWCFSCIVPVCKLFYSVFFHGYKAKETTSQFFLKKQWIVYPTPDLFLYSVHNYYHYHYYYCYCVFFKAFKTSKLCVLGSGKSWG